MKWIRDFLRTDTASSMLLGRNGASAQAFYFERPRIDERFKRALAEGAHIVVYGPPLQGKTTLVRRHLSDKDACFMDCRDDTKRKDIYRNVLTATGFQVVQEVRRRGKIGAKASVKFFDTGLEAGGDTEIETKMATLTADLSNANDVARLLGKAGGVTRLVLNNFQRLGENTKQNLLLDLSVFDEGSPLKIIIVGTWLDPLYLERYLPTISHRFEKIQFGFWSRDEVSAYLARLNDHLPTRMPDDVIAQASETTHGSIVSVNQLANLYCQCHASGPAGAAGRNSVSFAKLAEEFLVARFDELYVRKLCELAGHRDLLVNYPEAPRKTPKPKPPARGRQISPYVVELEDSDGFPRAHVGYWFLKYLIPQLRASKTEFRIGQLCEQFMAELNPKPGPINKRRLSRCFASIVDLQQELMIYPEIFALAGGDTIVVPDQEFIRFCTQANLDALREQLDEVAEVALEDLRVRRRNDLSRSG